MFCPLCKAEYSDGRTNCSDCSTKLVASQRDTQVTTLWRGSNPVVFQNIFWALRAAEIPCTGQKPWDVSAASKIPISQLRAKVDFQTLRTAVATGNWRILHQAWLAELSNGTWEIRVLAPDFNAAHEIVRQIEST